MISQKPFLKLTDNSRTQRPAKRGGIVMKFILIPGYVISANDGEEHFIDCIKLMKYYGLNRKDCIFATHDSGCYFAEPYNIVLRPRYSGDYREHLIRKLNLIYGEELRKLHDVIENG